jgi:UDP-glucose 4-epimerase
MSEGTQILVTGGAGFIGSHLVGRLLASGQSVVVLDDLSTGQLENLRGFGAEPRLRVITSKVSAYAQLHELVAECEFVFHLAAAVGVELVIKSPIRTIETNLRETEAILDAASARGVPVLLASTSEVYGRSAKPAFSEEDDLIIGSPQFARWSYACSKLMDEFLAMAHARERGLPAIVCRIFNTVGPRQTGRYGMVLPRFIQAACTGGPLRVFGDGRQTRCFCFVEDTVEAFLRLMRCRAARGEVFNVGGTDEISILDLARLVVARLGSSSAIELVPYHEAYMPGFDDMQRRRPVIDKLERFTQYRPRTPLEEIISRTAAASPPEAR